MDELAKLRRLIAEVDDDLRQLDELTERISGYDGQLAEPSCPPEVAGFVAVLLHRWYTACEAALERIERVLVGAVQSGDAWHQELLRIMALDVPDARPPVLRRETATALLPYLRFRHFLRHAYAAEFDPIKLHALVEPLTGVQGQLTCDLGSFVADTREAVRRAVADHDG